MIDASNILKRTELLLGSNVMSEISKTRVILFGVGGVGSWCAESLIRSGVGSLTIVDLDTVSVTNINRQMPATTKTVGLVKVDVVKHRLLEINPNANIEAVNGRYSAETVESFNLDSYDYIIDAIDSLENKVHLIQTATKTNAVFFSSMGAALKLDSTKIQVAEFWKVKGCPLAAALRRRLKKFGMPTKKFQCVFSEEVLPNKGAESYSVNEVSPYAKAQVNGTISHITAIFGFTLAGLVIQDINKKGSL